MDKPTKFMCSCNCEQVVKASEYNRLVQALWRISCMRPHKESTLEMKKIAKEAISGSYKDGTSNIHPSPDRHFISKRAGFKFGEDGEGG